MKVFMGRLERKVERRNRGEIDYILDEIIKIRKKMFNLCHDPSCKAKYSSDLCCPRNCDNQACEDRLDLETAILWQIFELTSFFSDMVEKSKEQKGRITVGIERKQFLNELGIFRNIIHFAFVVIGLHDEKYEKVCFLIDNLLTEIRHLFKELHPGRSKNIYYVKGKSERKKKINASY